MTIWNGHMGMSVTEFKQHCLEIIRRVETTGRSVTITRRGKVVARLQPPPAASARAQDARCEIAATHDIS